MSKSLTVAQLVSYALTVNTSLTSDEALKMIRTQKLRSYTRVAEAVKAAMVPVKAAKSKTGPRGFTFGPVFKASVATASGVAVKPSNRAKLVQLAAKFNVEIDDSFNEVEIATKIAASAEFSNEFATALNA